MRIILFQRAWVFFVNNYEPDAVVSFAEVIAKMLRSEKYILSANLFMNNAGQMREGAAESYWRTITTNVATEEDVRSMLYVPEYNARKARYWEEPMTIARPPVPQVPDDDFVPLEPEAGPSGLPTPVPVRRHRQITINSEDSSDESDADDRLAQTGYERIQRTIASYNKKQGKAPMASGGDSPRSPEEPPNAEDDEFLDDRNEDELSCDEGGSSYW